MTRIEILALGDVYPLNMRKIKAFGQRSSIFQIEKTWEHSNPEILNRPSLQLLDRDFQSLMNHRIEGDFLCVIVDRPLEGNFFSRRISERIIVVSIFDMSALNIHEGISIDMYVIRFLLGFSTIYAAYGGLTEKAGEIMQPNVTGCLFDLCMYKPQVARFFRDPKISVPVVNLLNGKTLSRNFTDNLRKESRKLKIGSYYRIKDWMKGNPVTAIVITFAAGLVFSELLGSYLFQLLTNVLN